MSNLTAPSFRPFRRVFDWVSVALTPLGLTITPTEILPVVSPTFDLFGSSQARLTQAATVLGTLGAIEVVHSRVPIGRVRVYQAMEYLHDDPTTHFLTAGRVITTPPGPSFPFTGLRDQVRALTGDRFAVRNVTVPPQGWIGCQANGMAAGTRITLRVQWVELSLGEYLVGIS